MRVSPDLGRRCAGARSADMETGRLGRRQGMDAVGRAQGRTAFHQSARDPQLQDHEADCGPVLPHYVHAESRRHAFPGGGNRARWYRAEDAGAGFRRGILANAGPAIRPGQGRLQAGRRAFHARALHQPPTKCSSRV